MRIMLATPLVIVVATCFSTGPPSAAGAEATLGATAGTPAELVRAALEAELAGPSAVRGKLLSEALARDPNFAPARWQAGFVRWDDQWLRPEEVAKHVAGDPRLAQYHQRRDAMVDTSDDHRELARWCHKHHLLAEEKVHWIKALAFEPNDEEALSALGLQFYEDQLLTKSQIDAAKKRELEQRRATSIWQPKLAKWRKAIESGKQPQRDEAIQAVARVDDPLAIGALEMVFGSAQTRHSGELQPLLIAALGRIQHPSATAALLRWSLGADQPFVRKLAADELKKRPLHAFVPQLIAQLPGKIKSQNYVTMLPGGTVLYHQELMLEGRQANVNLTYDSSVAAGDARAAVATVPRTLATDLAAARRTDAAIQATQAQLDAKRERVESVLLWTTGFTKVDDPALWQKQYDDYQGWASDEYAKPTYYQTAGNYRGYVTPPLETVVSNRQHYSCFVAGTPIVTAYGPRAIESIKPGDRVLCQNSETGELCFKPVETSTLRSANKLLRLRMGSDSIEMSLGHPLWVVGEGWRTAKQLKAGDRLHTLHGAVVVDAIEELGSREVYNLVVAELHDYFAGPTSLLAHDFTAPTEVPTRLPGLAVAGAR